MVKKIPSRDGNELEDPGCLLRQLEDAAPVVRSVHVVILYAHANPPRRLFEGGVYFTQRLQLCGVKVTGSLHADTRAVYLIKRYFIVFLSPKTKPCDPTWTWKTVLK